MLSHSKGLINRQLEHEVRDPHGRTCNPTAHLPERRKMMQLWMDYLDRLRPVLMSFGYNSA